MHLSAIPLGEMRTCTFCGSRLRAWYLLVGNPYKPSFPTVTVRGPHPNNILDSFRFHNRFIGISSETAGALQPRHCFALSQPEPESVGWSDLSIGH